MNDNIVKKKSQQIYTYLGSMVPADKSDIRRMALSSSVFGKLKERIWKQKDRLKSIKVCLYYAIVVLVATYVGEIRNLKEEDNRKLSEFENDCLKTMVGVSHINHAKMDDIRSNFGIPNKITDIIKKKRFELFGHQTTPVMSMILLTEN